MENEMQQEERQREFRATFWSYVRPPSAEDEGSTQLVDTRTQLLDALIVRDAQELVEFMEASDFAAVLTVRIHVSFANEKRLLEAKGDDTLNAYCAELLRTPEGRVYYQRVVELLAWAASQSEFRPYLLGAVATGHASEVAEDIAEDTEEKTDADLDEREELAS